MTDQQIIAQIKDGHVQNNELALRYVYRRHYKMIEAFVLKNNGTKDDAQDVFQDIVISLYNNVKEDKYSHLSQLTTYLFAIGKNIWYNKLRKNGRISLIDNDELDKNPGLEDIQGDIEYTEVQKQIGSLLHKVGQECATILKMFYFERLRMVKIAVNMNFASEQEAKNQKYKCMKKLKAFVKSSDYLQNELRSFN